MRRLTFAQLYVGYKDLLENPERQALLLSTESGRFYETTLRSQFEAMDKLGPGKESNAFLAKELDKADADHDAAVQAARLLLEAHVRAPGIAEAVAASARAALAALPTPSDLNRAYEKEVFLAAEAKERLSALEVAFRAFPLAGGGSAWDWITAYQKAASHIQELLSQRGDHSVDSEAQSRKEALRLRGAAQGLLGRLRTRLEEELTLKPELPRDLIARLFAYFDELIAKNEATPKSTPPATTSEAPAQGS